MRIGVAFKDKGKRGHASDDTDGLLEMIIFHLSLQIKILDICITKPKANQQKMQH